MWAMMKKSYPRGAPASVRWRTPPAYAASRSGAGAAYAATRNTPNTSLRRSACIRIEPSTRQKAVFLPPSYHGVGIFVSSFVALENCKMEAFLRRAVPMSPSDATETADPVLTTRVPRAQAAPSPADPARLAALRMTNLVDTPPEDVFDRITWLATQVTDCPMAPVSLLTSSRQWFKSRVELAAIASDEIKRRR
jgi:hypothetical protein